MKYRKLNVAAIIVNLTLFILTAYSVAHSFRQDIVRIPEEVNGTTLTDFTGIFSFRYFTNLSNAFVAITAAIMLFFNVKNTIKDDYAFPKWIAALKYCATCTVALTFFTVALFLSPLMAFYGKNYFTLFKGNGFFLHFFLPALAVCCFTFFEKSPDIPFQCTYLALLPAIAYSIVYTLMVAVFKVWPDFYSFTFNERYWSLPITITAMFALSYGVSVLVFFMRKKINAVK